MKSEDSVTFVKQCQKLEIYFFFRLINRISFLTRLLTSMLIYLTKTSSQIEAIRVMA